MGRIEREARRLQELPQRQQEARRTQAEAARARERARELEEQAQAAAEWQRQERQERERQTQIHDSAEAVLRAADVRGLLAELGRKHWRCGEIVEEVHGEDKTIELVHSWPEIVTETVGEDHYDERKEVQVVARIGFTVGPERAGRRTLQFTTNTDVNSFYPNAAPPKTEMVVGPGEDPARLRSFALEWVAKDRNRRREQDQMPRTAEKRAAPEVKEYRRR